MQVTVQKNFQCEEIFLNIFESDINTSFIAKLWRPSECAAQNLAEGSRGDQRPSLIHL